ncbi:MAG TPA: DUF2911 domain-containing protein [Gemmatimonadales bacterium]|nr:DUF2911 domain-containing protein [Gemmatimonadales bacterium]
MRAAHILGLVALGSGVVGSNAAAQERGSYVARIGTDTVAVDRFVRSRDRLDGQLILRPPRTTIIDYHLALSADGAPAKLEYTVLNADGTPASPARKGVVTFGADSVTMVATRGDSTRTSVAAVRRGAMPILSAFFSYALLAEEIHSALRSRGDSLPFHVYLPGSKSSFDTWLHREGADTVRVPYLFDAVLRARIASDGTIRELNTLESTVRAEAMLAPYEATDRLAAAWGAADRAGKGLGPLSPRDTARGTVGASTILVDYSRPHTRGRLIVGGLVPFGEVWRAGADAATQFESSTDLTLGGQRLTAGKYTLWILPTDSTRAELLVNSQTGQWGTDHDPARDILHLPLTVETLPAQVEEFTIAVGAGSEPRLSFTWDRTRWSLPVKAAP